MASAICSTRRALARARRGPRCAVAVLLPASVIERYFGGGFLTMLAMLVVGIPIYTCASASTPIAAALVLKG